MEREKKGRKEEGGRGRGGKEKGGKGKGGEERKKGKGGRGGGRRGGRRGRPKPKTQRKAITYDPVTDESMNDDWVFELKFDVLLTDLPQPDESENESLCGDSGPCGRRRSEWSCSDS